MVRRVNLLAFLLVAVGFLFGGSASTVGREGLRSTPPTPLRCDPHASVASLAVEGELAEEDEEEEEEEEEDEEEEGKTDKKKEKEKDNAKKKDEGEDDEDEDEDEDDKKDDGAEPKGKKPGSLPLPPRDPGLEKPSAKELDRSSPQVVVKEIPAFVVVRPGAGKAGKAAKPGKASAKEVEVDGSRWGFVDMAERKKRRSAWWDQRIVPLEKQAADEQAGTAEEREAARKQSIYYKAQKAKEMKAMERTRLRIELLDNPVVFLEIHVRERPPGIGGESQIKKSVRGGIEQDGLRVESERPENWRGKKLPGHTFILGGHPSDTVSNVQRRTYFLVAKPRNAGSVIVFFDCYAPPKLYDAKLEKEFDAFIRGTQFAGG